MGFYSHGVSALCGNAEFKEEVTVGILITVEVEEDKFYKTEMYSTEPTWEYTGAVSTSNGLAIPKR